jgi:integrase/recombinase XerD
VAPNTLRRKFTALSSFYDLHSRRGTDLHGFTRRSRQRWVTPDLDLRLRTASRPAYSALVPLRPVRARKPAVLTSAQVRQLLDACSRRRDRLLFAVLYDTGLRIGEALGLRHEDLDPRRQTIRVVAGHNANGARAKSGERTVPASAGLFTLYADYLDFEYGDLDTDHVFVNLWGSPQGAALSYSTVIDHCRRLRRATDVLFSPHTLRHTFATDLLRAGVATAVVSELLGHSQVTTTIGIYEHLDVEDLRAAMRAAGAATTREQVLA